MRFYSLKYTDNMPENIAGYAKAWFIRIKPKYIDDVGLLKHEICHVWQYFCTLGLHPFFYLCSKKYKLMAEVEAYREQLNWPPATEARIRYTQRYAEFIADTKRYRLNISVDEALKLLKE